MGNYERKTDHQGQWKSVCINYKPAPSNPKASEILLCDGNSMEKYLPNRLKNNRCFLYPIFFYSGFFDSFLESRKQTFAFL